MPLPLAWTLPFVLAGAVLYASVGHGGATAYLAVLALAGHDVAALATTVLVLNVLAASVAFVAFRQAGHLRVGLLLPFLATSVPAAYLGGRLPLPARGQELLLAVALLAGGLRLLVAPDPGPPRPRVPFAGAARWAGAPLLGAALGFLAGATGIGGGIFLSPVLLALGWADVRQAASVSSAFIVLNSLAGLAARLPREPPEVGVLLPLAAVVVPGAVAGAWMGARRLPLATLRRLLGAVLLVAAAKILFV